MKKEKKINSEELAEMADKGDDVTPYLTKTKKSKFKKLKEKNIQRTTVDFSKDMIDDLDKIAVFCNISRQALIKMVMHEHIIKFKSINKDKKKVG